VGRHLGPNHGCVGCNARCGGARLVQANTKIDLLSAN
jgi:hypothetical protein